MKGDWWKVMSDLKLIEILKYYGCKLIIILFNTELQLQVMNEPGLNPTVRTKSNQRSKMLTS